ncbi:protein ZBED8-like [Schistocerca piceifrons]|uniref:protein ZBED8-like n=1 Tax=Schistocerca piceifrons TaxID=274613 RepID=UPI001F5EFD6F|nr:protein ZBED8-like [Schistocerca piceifrons]
MAKRKKPFKDGEFVEEAFQEAADELFHNFKNKSEIVAAIEFIQLSSRTVTRRVEKRSNDVFFQLKTDLDECCYSSMQLDESTDATGTAQWPVFVRMVFNNFTVKEELLKVISLKGHTRGEDIFFAMKQLILSKKIPIHELVSISTDGAPALRGSTSGFIALCQRDESFNLSLYFTSAVSVWKVFKFE